MLNCEISWHDNIDIYKYDSEIFLAYENSLNTAHYLGY